MKTIKRLAFLTSLVMGVASVASAQPTYDDGRTYQRDRYDRYDQSRWSRDMHGRWIPVARGLSARTSRQFVDPPHGQRLRTLRIEAERGNPLIQQVVIQFQDGSSQKVLIDSRLNRGAGEVISLNRGPIGRIVVYTDPRYAGSYSVYAT